MTDCIERDMILKMISHKPSSPTTEREDRLIDGFISAVKNCPAADVRPVVMGKWKRNERGNYNCSNCKSEHNAVFGFIFCPICGAVMGEN